MRIATNKMRRILYLMVIGLVMLTMIAPLNAPTSRIVSARTQQPASIKTGAFTDVETMLSRIFPLYKADSWLNKGRNGSDALNSLLKLGLSNKLIVPVQEPGKTHVPFKGLITREGILKEGNVSLVLKIYDKANGGTKLYEATHEVDVTQGMYFAVIQVPSDTIAKSQTIWLEASSVEEPELPLEPRQSIATRAEVSTNAVLGVGLCKTCGSLDTFMGAIPVPTSRTGVGNESTWPTEFGFGCGPEEATGISRPIRRHDTNPFLCVRFG